MLTEARVILPGAQALLGFQLAIVLTDPFEKLPSLPRLLHAAALMSVALSVALLITPAALHRIVWAGEDTEAILAIGGRVTILALLPLAMGMAGDSYVVLSRVLGSAAPAAVAATLVLLYLIGFWFAWPFVERFQRRSGFLKSVRESLNWIAELSQHQPDGSQSDECEGITAPVLKILGQSTAPVKPGEGAFDYPAPGQNHEALGRSERLTISTANPGNSLASSARNFGPW